MEAVIILIVVGAVLLLAETVLPGLIAGILGAGCLIAAVVLGFYEFGARTGTFILLVVCLGLLVGAVCWIKYFPSSRIAKVFISESSVGNLGVEKPELLDQTGVAVTNLRPSGTALIDGKRIDVVAETGLIERGTPVKVVAIEGLRVVVRPA